MSFPYVPSTVTGVHADTQRMRLAMAFKEVADETLRNLGAMQLMQKYGRLMFNVPVSYANKWRIRFNLPTAVAYPKDGNISFDNPEQFKEAVTDYRAFLVAQSVTEWDYRLNKAGQGEAYTIPLTVDRLKAMGESAKVQFNNLFYNDGDAAATNQLPHGVESVLADDGATTAADIVAAPNDTYAGLTTGFADYGGAGQWTTDLSTPPNAGIGNDWPNGHGPFPADFNTPLLGNDGSTSWESGTNWQDNNEEVLRYVITTQQNRIGKVPERETSAPYVALMNAHRFRQIKNYMSTKGIITLPEEGIGRDYGMPNSFQFEGATIATDYYCPTDAVYLWDPGACEYFTEQGQLFDVNGFEYEMLHQKHYALLTAFGQYRWRPRHVGKIKTYATA